MTSTPEDPGFEALLHYIRRSRCFDFTGYKRASLTRRITHRMQSLGIANYADYRDHLEVDPEEFAHLFDTILINVTGFFRDPEAWEYLREELLPRLLSRKQIGDSVRLWSAGCSSGEEAYTLAMVAAELQGARQFQADTKVYGTDVDEDALNKARRGIFTAQGVEAIPADLVDKYFEVADDDGGKAFQIRGDLRRRMVFGRLDLVNDAPISHLDLLACRNTLMYFNAETQQRILDRFHFALKPEGILFLGKAETALGYTSMFQPLDLRHRVFEKVAATEPTQRILARIANGRQTSDPVVSSFRLRDIVFETAPMAQVVIDNEGRLVLANREARRLFALEQRDLGRFLDDLSLSYRPADLRTAIDRAHVQSGPTFIPQVEWQIDQHLVRYLDIEIMPLQREEDETVGTLVSFTDMTPYRKLEQDLEATNHELSIAYEELQSSNEELETTNEELQSAVEELETTNEELQSTNEELETMNEELQSTNDELHITNQELRRHQSELNHINLLLESVLASLGQAVIVVDSDLVIQIWNGEAEDLWGVRIEEAIGIHFLNLDIGLPVSRLHDPLRECLLGEWSTKELVIPARNRRGKDINCRVSIGPQLGPGKEIVGAVMFMKETEQPPAQLEGLPGERLRA